MKTSSYYPPRAGRLSRFLAVTNHLGARLRMPNVDLPVEGAGVFLEGLPWLLVPGLMWQQRGRTTLGAGVLAAWAILMAISITSLNVPLAGTAVTLAAALHAISAAAALTVFCPHWQGISRLWRTSLFSSLLVFLVYAVGLRNVVPPFAQRVAARGTTVMIHQANWFSNHPWTQGEWVAYRLPVGRMNFDRILAGPGDTIRFHPDSFEVNGRFFERVSPHMPASGERVMDAGTYLIWPTEVSFTYADGNEQDLLLLGLAEIEEDDILGRPYRRWFWKSPVLETLKPISDATHTPSP